MLIQVTELLDVVVNPDFTPNNNNQEKIRSTLKVFERLRKDHCLTTTKQREFDWPSNLL